MKKMKWVLGLICALFTSGNAFAGKWDLKMSCSGTVIESKLWWFFEVGNQVSASFEMDLEKQECQKSSKEIPNVLVTYRSCDLTYSGPIKVEINSKWCGKRCRNRYLEINEGHLHYITASTTYTMPKFPWEEPFVTQEVTAFEALDQKIPNGGSVHFWNPYSKRYGDGLLTGRDDAIHNPENRVIPSTSSEIEFYMQYEVFGTRALQVALRCKPVLRRTF